jgi:hypothetical protein
MKWRSPTPKYFFFIFEVVYRSPLLPINLLPTKSPDFERHFKLFQKIFLGFASSGSDINFAMGKKRGVGGGGIKSFPRFPPILSNSFLFFLPKIETKPGHPILQQHPNYCMSDEWYTVWTIITFLLQLYIYTWQNICIAFTKIHPNMYTYRYCLPASKSLKFWRLLFKILS